MCVYSKCSPQPGGPLGPPRTPSPPGPKRFRGGGWGQDLSLSAPHGDVVSLFLDSVEAPPPHHLDAAPTSPLRQQYETSLPNPFPSPLPRNPTKGIEMQEVASEEALFCEGVDVCLLKMLRSLWVIQICMQNMKFF